MKSLVLLVAVLGVLGTAKANDEFKVTVWIDKYEINAVTPDDFVQVQVKFNFDKKSEIETIFKDNLSQFGVKIKVLSLEDGFVTYKWELFQMKKGKWQSIEVEDNTVETMLGSSKLMNQTIILPTKQKEEVSLQYMMSLEKV